MLILKPQWEEVDTHRRVNVPIFFVNFRCKLGWLPDSGQKFCVKLVSSMPTPKFDVLYGLQVNC